MGKTAPPAALDFDSLVERACADTPPAREEALEMLRLPDEETLGLVAAAWRVRRHFCGTTVQVSVLLNARSGLCAEDCHYCSQSSVSSSGIDRHEMVEVDDIVKGARQAKASGAARFCVATSTSTANRTVVARVAEATRRIKAELGIEVCASLGLLGAGEARALKDAGLDSYNHNLNTSPANYAKVCTTHGYEDRVRTLKEARAAGLSICSGVILGMGESDGEIVELAFALREAGARSLPVNFLLPIPGTPLGEVGPSRPLSPWFCLRALCLFRFVNPRSELRASAGREAHIRSLQPLALLVANSLFLGDYLTAPGQDARRDWEMLSDLGLTPQTSDVGKLFLEGGAPSAGEAEERP